MKTSLDYLNFDDLYKAVSALKGWEDLKRNLDHTFNFHPQLKGVTNSQHHHNSDKSTTTTEKVTS